MSLFSPCNWLQVYENIMDHLHVATLHNPQMMTVQGVNDSEIEDMDYAAPMGFTEQPALVWEPTRGGNGMCFIACRRNQDDQTVWVLIVETIFQVPGMGQHFVNAATTRDEFLLLGVSLFFGFLIVVMNLLADVLTGLLDPRVRIAGNAD